ncbi:MAG TPA: cellulose binding domain-containing protein, partial [Herpetosiphonaceae bacterium]
VQIANTGAAINGWTLAWAFGGDQRISNAWNATASQSGQQVAARNVDWNAAIAPGGTASLGFQATFSGANAKPAAFALNGAACAVTP